MTITYMPADFLDNSPFEPYSWDDLIELLRHHREEGSDVPIELRELSDGRVVDADWDPASNPNPTVYARIVEPEEPEEPEEHPAIWIMIDPDTFDPNVLPDGVREEWAGRVVEYLKERLAELHPDADVSVEIGLEGRAVLDHSHDADLGELVNQAVIACEPIEVAR